MQDVIAMVIEQGKIGEKYGEFTQVYLAYMVSVLPQL